MTDIKLQSVITPALHYGYGKSNNVTASLSCDRKYVLRQTDLCALNCYYFTVFNIVPLSGYTLQLGKKDKVRLIHNNIARVAGLTTLVVGIVVSLQRRSLH